MADPIKVALLSHAGGAHVGAYLSALAETEACGSVVLGDPDGRWEAECREKLGDKLTKVYRDVPQLLDVEQPKLALISMEAKVAPPVINAALEAECHVFSEKPACVRVADFEPLVEKADSKHRYLMLALANRTNPEMLKARELITSGKIGKLYGVEAHIIADQTRLTRSSYHKQWYADKARAGGGHLIWLGIHWIDLTMHLSGSNIDQVAGFTTNIGGQPLNVEDSATAALHYDNGMLGTMTSGYYLDKKYHQHLRFWGSNGWVNLEPMHDRPLTWYVNTGDNAGEVQTWDGPKEPRGYTPFVQAAVQACADMTDPPITSADSLRTLRTVHGIYESAESGRTVMLNH